MRVESYSLKLVNNHCIPDAVTLNAVASLSGDAGPAIPYLNTVLGSSAFVRDIPAATFKSQGKLISVRPDQVTVNGVRDREEAEKIIDWMIREINDAWENRSAISPTWTAAAQPEMIRVLEHLPKTNCGKCLEPTCMVLALRLCQGAKAIDACPGISADSARAVTEYLSGFTFD